MNTVAPATNASEVPRIRGLSQIAGGYDLLLCDVWGVLHNGLEAKPPAIAALSAFRQTGGTVIMITNAPRQRKSVFAQLTRLGVPDGTYDTVVTSGDVTRNLIEEGPARILHIGTEKDLNLFEGMDVQLVGEEEAEIIVCSGPWDEQTETPEDYTGLLTRLKQRDLSFICANPDIVVELGDRLIYCAGALAREYERLGGRTQIAGKPHRPNYDLAVSEAERIAGRAFDKRRILAIGDGMPTDVAGAAAYGLDVLYISGGIHAHDYGTPDEPDHDRLGRFLAEHGAQPVAYMPRLEW